MHAAELKYDKNIMYIVQLLQFLEVLNTKNCDKTSMLHSSTSTSLKYYADRHQQIA